MLINMRGFEVIMKIIVDEMPRCSNECIFSDGYYACNLLQGKSCNPGKCDLLKPITDYVFEDYIAENIVKRIPLTDIGKR
mgnify:CR=1 FL=1